MAVAVDLTRYVLDARAIANYHRTMITAATIARARRRIPAVGPAVRV
jgi:hypothetical protein